MHPVQICKPSVPWGRPCLAQLASLSDHIPAGKNASCKFALCISASLSLSTPSTPITFGAYSQAGVSRCLGGGCRGFGRVRCLLDSRCCQLTSPPRALRGSVCGCRGRGEVVGRYVCLVMVFIELTQVILSQADRQHHALFSPCALGLSLSATCHTGASETSQLHPENNIPANRPCLFEGRRHKILLNLAV